MVLPIIHAVVDKFKSKEVAGVVQTKTNFTYLMKIHIEQAYGKPIQQISDEQIQKFIDLTNQN